LKISDRMSYIKAAFTGLPNQSMLRMVQRMTPTYGEPPRRSTDDWNDLYNKSPRMIPIHQISSDVATSIYGIYKKNDTKKIKIPNNNVEMLLKKPTPNLTITEYALFYITQVYLLLPSGEAFWIKERNELGKVTELWPVPPGWVNEIPSKSKDYFTIYPQGNMQCQPIYIPPRDMVYFKKPDINNPYLRGMGRAEGVGDEIETDEYMAKYQKRFFFNDAIPSMVGMMPGADEPSINRQKEQWQQEHGGYNNSNKVSWLNWDAKFQILKETNKDMDFIESRKYLRDATNQHFSIPPELFGILENSNRSTIDAAYYLYTKNVLRKELKFIDDTLNVQLMPEFSKENYIEHDNVVPEDDEFKLKQASEGLKNGGILVDEWRLANGWEVLPNGKGQILYTPLNMMPTSLTDSAVDTNLPPENEFPVQPEKTVKKKLTPEHKNQIWNVIDKAAVKNERGFANAMKKYFQSQQDRINKSLEKSVKAATDNPDELLDWEAEDSALVAALSPLWIASLQDGFETVNETYEFGISLDEVNFRFTEWVEENGLKQAKEINDTTQDKLRKTLSEGIQEGESIPKLRDRVSSVYTEAKTSRATTIARTETHNTVGAGTHETYKAVNVSQKEWLTSMDGRERPSHAALNGEVAGIDRAFSNGLMYPGDPGGSPEEIVNCRCVELPVLPE
jgi:HK97 family phage portal protein